MKLSKEQIKNLAWPDGATHIRVTTADNKQAVSTRKSAPTSLDGVDGDWAFGALVKTGKGNDSKEHWAQFAPLADTPVTVKEEKSAVRPAQDGRTRNAAGLTKCGYITSLYLGDELLSRDEILKRTLAEFPDADPAKTRITVFVMGGDLKRAGKPARWSDPPRTSGGHVREKGPKAKALEALLDPALDVAHAKPQQLRELVNALRAAHTSGQVTPQPAPVPQPEPEPQPAVAPEATTEQASAETEAKPAETAKPRKAKKSKSN